MSSSKVLLLNEKFSDNVGDVAIHDVFVDYLRSCDVEVIDVDYSGRIAYKEYTPKENRKSKNVFYVFKRPLYRFMWSLQTLRKANRSLRRCHAVIIGGGQLLRFNGVFPWYFIFWVGLSFLFGKKISVISVGTEGNGSYLDTFLMRMALVLVDSISVRDDYSRKFLTRLTRRPIHIVPDVVYLAKPKEKLEYRTSTLLCVTNYTEIDSVYFKHSEEEYKDALLQIFKQYEGVTLACTTQSDFNFAKELFKDEEVILFGSWQELDNCVASSRRVISSRMHPLIFAKKNDVEYIEVIEVNRKLTEFSRIMNAPQDISILTNQIAGAINV